MKIQIVNRTRILVHDAEVRNFLAALLKLLAETQRLRRPSLLRRPELTLVFVSKEAMRKINREFRGKDYATDVLSFAALGSDSVGELIFCPFVLKRQAIDQNHSLSREWAYMLIHGFLHLLGYDHELSPREEKKMFELQDAVYRQLTASEKNLRLIYYVNRNRAQRSKKNDSES